MNRRDFLKNSSVAGLALSSIAVAGSLDAAAQPGKNKASAAPPYQPDNFKLNETSITELQDKMRSGQYTSRLITEMYIKRIHDIDKHGPALNAVIELNPDALLIADRMDSERKAGKVRGPLHGIPVLVKDNINTGDKMSTTAGSIALDGHRAEKDAFIIQRLREAGAVLLGKTNLSEWANFRSTRSTSGWSSRGGQTKNPCILDRNPCGSSSGSGAAVAANLCSVAIGTETDGSITAPASMCGIVGLKPTVGLLSRNGIIPISKTQDTAGPMGRTVKDVAMLLGALCGVDANDPVTLESSGKALKDYSAGLSKDALKGKRIGIEKLYLKGHEGIVALYQKAIETLKQAGASVIEVELVTPIGALTDAELILMKYEFKDGLDQYLANANAKVKSMTELIAFNKKNASTAMPFFQQEILEDSDSKGSLDSKEYLEAWEKARGSRKIIDDLLKENALDAICSTTIGLPCCIDLVNGDYDTGFYFGTAAAMAGYPHISVPMGKVHELPLGFSFISGPYREAELLGMAYAYEQASKKRELPKFLKTVTS